MTWIRRDRFCVASRDMSPLSHHVDVRIHVITSHTSTGRYGYRKAYVKCPQEGLGIIVCDSTIVSPGVSKFTGSGLLFYEELETSPHLRISLGGCLWPEVKEALPDCRSRCVWQGAVSSPRGVDVGYVPTDDDGTQVNAVWRFLVANLYLSRFSFRQVDTPGERRVEQGLPRILRLEELN